MIKWTSLHTHSDASILDGLRPVAELVRAAKNMGFESLAVTDHGSLANAVSFTIEAELQGIKPILGIEAYVDVDGETGHLTLLADGNRGFENIIQLNNIGHLSDRKHPSFTIDDLIKHAEDVILLTGCVSSPLNKMSESDSLRLGSRLKAAFGPRMFSEVMFIADTDTWSKPIRLSEKLGTKLVITNDVHFPYQDDASMHTILTQMKAGFDYHSKELWLKRPDQIWERAKEVIPQRTFDGAILRAYNIGRLIKPVVLKRKPSLPTRIGDIGKLRELVDKAIVESDRIPSGIGPAWDVYRIRAEYELGIIEKMGYNSYFLILLDLVEQARLAGTRIGPGRGSGAGSLVLYLLNITDIDPIKFDLSFERFLNPYREGMPDVDMDFDSEHRELVIKAAKERWGALPIATYARYSHKVLVHDLAKFFKIPREIEKQAADRGPESPEFKQVSDEFPDFHKAYLAISGQIRHKGKHAGGVVITDVTVPEERVGDAVAVSWTEGERNELSYAGIVKFDLLGLAVLTALQQLEVRFGQHAPFPPLPGSPVFEIFKSGNLAGIFQFSGSSGIKNLTMRLNPDQFEDLVAINALYRPGALDVGSTDHYPEWKKKPRTVHPLVDPILKSTYGAVVYQEQVMQIFAAVMGGSLGEADLARRVIVKSKESDPTWAPKIEALKRSFVAAAVAKMPMDVAERLWEELASHARYSFNRAHAVAYARIAWETAWWKHYHPTAFYAAMMNTSPDEVQEFIFAASGEGIKFLPPSLVRPSNEFAATDDESGIHVPISFIKFLGEKGANEVIAKAKERPFASVADFVARVSKRAVTKRAREGLYALGAFKALSADGTDAKLLGVDPLELSRLTVYEAQQRFLGIIIPSKRFMDWLENEKLLGKVAGIVMTIKNKESRWGPYVVFYLAPEGVVWMRPNPGTVKVGDIVTAKTRKDSGKALLITKKRL
jgi:DNA polymerase-3 subunit alpha